MAYEVSCLVTLKSRLGLEAMMSRLGLEAMLSRLGLEAMMSRLGLEAMMFRLGRFGPRSSSATVGKSLVCERFLIC